MNLDIGLGDTEEDLRKNARAVKKRIFFYASTRTYQTCSRCTGSRISSRDCT